MILAALNHDTGTEWAIVGLAFGVFMLWVFGLLK